MFGKYEVKIDDKHRFFVPSECREMFDAKVVFMDLPNYTLIVNANKFIDAIDSVDLSRDELRYIASHVINGNVDSLYRIVLPSSICLKIEGNIVALVRINNTLELWNPESLEKKLDETAFDVQKLKLGKK